MFRRGAGTSQSESTVVGMEFFLYRKFPKRYPQPHRQPDATQQQSLGPTRGGKSMRAKKIVRTQLAPEPKGPYSQGIIAGDLVFVAGQGPVDPQSGRFILGDIREECELTLKNLEAILKASGTTLANVVQCTVYLGDLADFEAMNQVYGRFFPAHCPARTTLQAGKLLRGIKVEIDAVALIPNRRHKRASPR